jgi:hypothetical protein
MTFLVTRNLLPHTIAPKHFHGLEICPYTSRPEKVIKPDNLSTNFDGSRNQLASATATGLRYPGIPVRSGQGVHLGAEH